ncbi:MFS transporter [uncultured Pseudokineococcus sp.]|uniref:MFS transporter n=1 Tax=uncultured Pseudokineococcus sp. TaxID=1642928 RepID=UPI0026334CE0|nr:MFS transporter [uncultured Pseudokineococcus sp.]
MDASTVRIGVGGAAVVGVAFGMARYVYGLTLPDVRAEFGMSELLLGLVASGTFAGYLLGLVGAPRLSARRGPRAPTTVGGVCGVAGCATVALAPSPSVLAVGAVLAGSAAGWVWAPYSDIAAAAVPRRDRPAVLAVITTGTSAGLVALAGLSVLTGAASWRWTWAGIAGAAAVAAVVNLRAVPRLPAHRTDAGAPRASPLRRAMARPLVYAVLYFAATTVYFTYVSDVARTGGRGAGVAALVFALVGAGGLIGLGTGRMAQAVGAPVVAVLSVCVVGGALVLLALGRASLLLVLLSAVLFGVGYMVGSAVLAIWTAQVVADRPGDGFTVALVVGALTSIAAPAVMGALIPLVGLPVMLAAVAVVAVSGALVVAAAPRLRARVVSQRGRR